MSLNFSDKESLKKEAPEPKGKKKAAKKKSEAETAEPPKGFTWSREAEAATKDYWADFDPYGRRHPEEDFPRKPVRGNRGGSAARGYRMQGRYGPPPGYASRDYDEYYQPQRMPPRYARGPYRGSEELPERPGFYAGHRQFRMDRSRGYPPLEDERPTYKRGPPRGGARQTQIKSK